MKKIIALLLVFVTAFALVACTGNNESTTDGSATIDDYNTAISATTPTTVKVNTTYENTTPAATLNGEYNITYNVDGTATISYKYDKLNSIGAEKMVEEVAGTVELLASGEMSGDIDKTVAAAATKKITLDASKMDYSISMGVLNATVKASNTASIFGVDLGSDATLLMRITNEGKIGSYSINYSTPAGKAGIVCIFD